MVVLATCTINLWKSGDENMAKTRKSVNQHKKTKYIIGDLWCEHKNSKSYIIPEAIHSRLLSLDIIVMSSAKVAGVGKPEVNRLYRNGLVSLRHSYIIWYMRIILQYTICISQHAIWKIKLISLLRMKIASY